MIPKSIAIGADHAGFTLKCALKSALAGSDCEVLDVGTGDAASVDYPDYAEAVVAEIRAGRAARGILICGSGIGMSIAANRHREIRAALCYNEEAARLARRHNDANVLVLGARTTAEPEALRCLEAFLATEFEGGRHARRVAKLTG